MAKLPKPPTPEEQIRPDALVRTIKKEKTGAGEKLKDIPVTPENYRKFKGDRPAPKDKLPHGIWWGIAGLVAIFIVGSIISFYVVKAKVKQSITIQAQTLATGVADLQNLDTQSASQEFSLLTAESSTPSIENVLGVFGSLFSGGRNAVAAFSDLAKQLATLSTEAGSLEGGVFHFVAATTSTSTPSIAEASDTDLVVQLTNVRDTLAAIDTDSNQLSGALTAIDASSTMGDNNLYLPLKARVEGAEDFLNAFIPWFATSTPHHILVLFENTSEMRPGGGFIGSYADVTIASGSIQNISMHDVADADANFAPRIEPPLPLQLEVKGLRPADGNWFLDFPTSASETLSLFQEAQLYNGSSGASSTSFDGVIAITPQVVRDLLTVTGPLTADGTSFTSANLLIQVQNIVQKGLAVQNAGAAQAAATYPKAILGQLSQAIFQQLAASSTDVQKQQLLTFALGWVANRDVMAYFTNPALENFITSYGADGSVYQLPQNFNGDYLSLADADINSDKSELYVAQNVSLDAQIGADGTITDTLSITRQHNGNQSQYWWYQTTNQDYLQVFVPSDASLVNETGGVVKKIAAPLNYASPRNGYSTDPTIVAIVSSTQPFLLYPAVTSHEEAGKEVFATWVITPKGKSTTVEFDYTHPAFIPPAAGVQYQFVFDKQAGSARTYALEIDAPLGYVFAENGLATYEYQSSNPPGRLVVDLTLEKL